MIKEIIEAVKGDEWVVRRCLWPYPEGYGTYSRSKHTLLDMGLTKQEAEEACKELNKKQ